MMVMFVSQCEKKALHKTRRVLDSFANRIGDNSWQTIITQDGLDAVKKLLRKTASKNTAVSCHWLRSRSRTDLVWIIGSKQKFNEQGLVPVNYTTKDILVKYDESTPVYYANTQGQSLKDHLYAVGWVAQRLVQKLYPDIENLDKAALIAGLWHDIGKLDPIFQDWLKKELNKKLNDDYVAEDGVHIEKGKFSFEKHPRHNEISLILFNALNGDQDKPIRSFIEHVIYWHHAKPIRKNDFNNQSEILSMLRCGLTADLAFQELIKRANVMIANLYMRFDMLFPNNDSSLDDFEALESDLQKVLPNYKTYNDKHSNINHFDKDIIANAKKDIVRAAVISADRLVSSFSSEKLQELTEKQSLEDEVNTLLDQSGSNLKDEIEACMQRFKQAGDATRNAQQTEAAEKLSRTQCEAVLEGPAGCGKTKIALEWAAKKNVKKLIWVCPRVQVCLGIYDELTSDAYLPETKIELLTGEYKKTKQNHKEKDTLEVEKFSGDIVITTIDQIANTITSHRNITGLVEFLNAHVVFDEFHELIKITGLNLLFSELFKAKKLREEQANILLVSATINPLFLTGVLGVHKDDIISVETFNQSDYEIGFQGYDETNEESPLVSQTYKPNTFVISNTAKAAQLGFIRHQINENAILFHGRYKKNDKRLIFEQVYQAFKRNGTREFDILRSGPIVQASLNISCDEMHTELTSPENWLQRLGRLDRFGQNASCNRYITYLPKTVKETGKQSCNLARFLNKQFEFQASYQWFLWLDDKLENRKTVKLSWLYKQYQDFYQQRKEKLIDEQLKLLQKSAGLLTKKLVDPIAIKLKSIKPDTPMIKASSLRGDSRFVQMAVVQFDEAGGYDITNEYACDFVKPDNQFTMTVDEIQGYDEGGDDNLIHYMHQKHHKIMKSKGEKYTKRHKSYLLKNEATSAETPVYLSYTAADLALCHDNPHPSAIYYAQGIKQPIGAIAIHKLNDSEDE
ncbi:MAG: CRISPR-associated endonuclease Cas3'' [Methyloprofundus sp.]|nr:CRISPR-associated endonuclease Cas3'' [Methyloprofundus sp.]